MPLDPRAIERGTPGLAIPAQAGELERRLAGLERLLSFGAAPPWRTTLPASPRDNQEIDLVGGTDRLWRLRYQAAAARWRFIGGPPLHSGPAGAISTNSTTRASPGGGPSLTVPFTGAYHCTWGFYTDIQSTATTQAVTQFMRNGAAIATGYITGRGGGGGASAAGPTFTASFNAGDVLDLTFYGTVGGVAYYGDAFWLSALPLYLT